MELTLGKCTILGKVVFFSWGGVPEGLSWELSAVDVSSSQENEFFCPETEMGLGNPRGIPEHQNTIEPFISYTCWNVLFHSVSYHSPMVLLWAELRLCFSLWKAIHLHVASTSRASPWILVSLSPERMHITMTLYFLLAPSILWLNMKAHCHSVVIKTVKCFLASVFVLCYGMNHNPPKFIFWILDAQYHRMWLCLEIVIKLKSGHKLMQYDRCPYKKRRLINLSVHR